jgi:hypothetical protein
MVDTIAPLRRGVQPTIQVAVLACAAVLLITTLAGPSAMAQDLAWVSQFGTNFSDGALAVDVDGAGSVYVVGDTGSALPGQTPSGEEDAYIRKYDSAGNVLWTRQFGTPASDQARDVAAGAGNVSVAGITRGALAGTPSGDYDAFVRKYDSAGNVIWTRQFGSAGLDLANSLAVDDSGNLYVAGTTGGALPGQVSSGTDDAFVRKYDPNGNEVWTRQFGTAAGDYANGVAVGSAGEIYVVGFTTGSLAGQTPAGGEDAFVRRYDASGNELWTRQFGSPSLDQATSVAVGDAGEVYVVGYTDGALPGQTSAGGSDAFVRRYDPSGIELWTRQFGTPADDVALAVDVGPAGVYVGGHTGGSLNGGSAGGVDGFVRAFDPGGSELWTHQFGTPANDIVAGLATDGTDVYVAGSTEGAFPGNVNAGGADAYLARIAGPAAPPSSTTTTVGCVGGGSERLADAQRALLTLARFTDPATIEILRDKLRSLGCPPGPTSTTTSSVPSTTTTTPSASTTTSSTPTSRPTTTSTTRAEDGDPICDALRRQAERADIPQIRRQLEALVKRQGCP